MVAPVWSTPAGFLGTFTQEIQFVATGSNITLALATDQPNSTFSIISGILPSGLHLYPNNGIIYGTPYYTNEIITSTFVARATNSDGVADRTFSIDIAGPTDPTWVTSAGLLPVGSNGELYALNLDRVYLQLNAKTPKLPRGQVMRYYLKANSGQLPPGLTLNQQGLISGTVNDVLTLDYLANIDGGYDEEFYDSAPYDHVVIIKDTKQGRPEAIAKIYEFTVVATDGISKSEQLFLIRVEDPNALRADNVELNDKSVTVSGTINSNILTVTSNTSTTMPAVGSAIFGPQDPVTYAPLVIREIPGTYVESVNFTNSTFTINSSLLSTYNGTLFYKAPLLNELGGQNTALSGDSAIFKSSVGFLVPPQWVDSNGVQLPTVANLGTFRSNNYQIIQLNTYDPNPYEGAVTYDWLSEINNPEIRMVTDSVFDPAGIPKANLFGQSQLYVKLVSAVPTVGMQFKLDSYVTGADNKIYTVAGVTAIAAGTTISELSVAATNNLYKLDLGITTKYIDTLPPATGYTSQQLTARYPEITTGIVGSAGSTTVSISNIQAIQVGMSVTGPGIQNYTRITSTNNVTRTATISEPLTADVNAILTFGPALGDLYQYYNAIRQSTNYIVWTENGWSLDYTTNPGIVSGVGIIKLGIKIPDTTNIYTGSKSVHPSGLTLNPITGELYGILPYQPNYSETYKFTVRVTKQDYNTSDTVYKDQMFLLTLQGQVQTSIEFVSTGSLGVVVPGQPSELQVIAHHINNSTLSINYIQTGGKLPTGISLARDGTLVGTVPYGNLTSIDVNNLGFNKFTLDQGATTLDREFKFIVTADDVYLQASTTKEFNLKIYEYTPVLYTGLFFKPLMKVASRQHFRSLVQNYNVFSPELLYRPEDPAFGVQDSIKMYLEYGLQELNLDYYMPALVNYFKRKRFYFGDVTSAIAQDANGNNIYEVVYVNIIDDQMIGNTNPDASFTESDNGVVTTFYPDSTGNMQSALANIPVSTNASGIISVDDTFRPRFMQTIQSSTGTPLGFVKAVILCYALPGNASQIISRIKTTNFDFKQLDFDVDRLYIEKSLTSTSTAYLLFGTGASSSGFNIVAEDGILDPADPNYNAQYIQFIAGQEITTEAGVVLTI